MNAATGAEQAFARTDPGVMEVKELPAGRLLEYAADGPYFKHANELFRPLFRYIRDHDIAMTTPVEARMEPGAMYFWVSPSQVDKVTGDQDGVRVIDLPPRTVAAIGVRGGYSERNFARATEQLMAWLESNPDLVPAGPAYAVFWNGPFTPWFLKQFEVHVPARLRDPAPAAP